MTKSHSLAQRFFDSVILRYPRTVIFFLLTIVAFFTFQAKHFRLDASAETLVLENDNGFYIVWPLLGPSTLRDSIGKVGGLFLDPVSYAEPIETVMGINAVRFTNENSYHLGEYENLKSDALDPYVAMREIYIQYRREQIRK